VIAALDNNVMGQQIKLVVRNRKNAGVFKSAVGADVGDIIIVDEALKVTSHDIRNG
jgi:hypothetical protein